MAKETRRDKPKIPRGYRLIDDPKYAICPDDMLWNETYEHWFMASVPIGRLLSATGYDFIASLDAPHGCILCYNRDHIINDIDLWRDGATCVWHTFANSEFGHHIGRAMGCGYWRVIAVSRSWLKEQQQKESEANVTKEATTKAIETTTSGGLAAIVPDIKEGLKLSAGKAAAEACSALIWESAKRVGIERPVVFSQRDVELLVVSVLTQFALEAAKTVVPDNKYLPKAQKLASLATTACAKDSADFIRGVLLTDVVAFAKKLVERVHLDDVVDEPEGK